MIAINFIILCTIADCFPSFSQPSRTDEEDNDNEVDNSDDSSEAEDTAASSKSQDVSDVLNDLFAKISRFIYYQRK